MDPQIIDHYNGMPYGVNVIDKMNEEFNVAQREIDELKKQNKLLKDNIYDKPLVERFKISKEEISEYNTIVDDINRELDVKLHEAVNEDEELDLNKVFNSVEDYINMLHPKLGVSREWCEYRIKNGLKDFHPLLCQQSYWWDNMIKDELGEIIIGKIKFAIVNGGGTDIDVWNWMDKYDIQLCELYVVECEKCHEDTPMNDGGIEDDDKWTCMECWTGDDSGSEENE
jgi:hypothetical protein